VKESKFDTLFLDRDGVINRKLDGRYVHSFSEFEFIKGFFSAIRSLSKIFNRVVIVTNQQCVGKGLMSEKELYSIHQKMLKEIVKNGGKIEKIYYCPHLVEQQCTCRKPKTGMLQNVINDYPDIVIENSYLVGDSDTDIIAGNHFGLKTVKVDNKYTLLKWCEQVFLK